MSTQIQRRRGTTAQHASFTGAIGETTIDTDKEVVVVHDGTQVGGYPLMRENASNSALALGSAATPSLKFTGDPNTGIYSPGADQVAVSTGGTGRVFVDASGNVGIKTTTTTYDPAKVGTSHTFLSIQSGASSYSNVNIAGNKTSAGGIGQLAFVNDANSASYKYSSWIQALSTGATAGQLGGSLVFSTTGEGSAAGPVERLRITSAGLVGVGNSIPGSFEPTGNNLVVGSGSSNQGITVYSGSASQGLIYFADGTIGAQKYTGFISYDHNTNAMRFGTNDGNERLRIDSSGRLGIGTSSPSNKLSVTGTLSETVPAVNLYTGGHSAPITSFSARPGLELLAYQSTAGSPFTKTSAIIANSDGTVPSELQFWTKTSGQSSPAERVRIDSSGRLGIGTTSPNQALEVVGSQWLRGAYTDTTGLGFVGNSGTGRDFVIKRSAASTMSIEMSGRNAFNIIGNTGDTNCNITFSTTGASEAARIDSSGRLLVGTSSARAVGQNANTAPIQVETATNTAAVQIVANPVSAAGPTLFFGKSRGGSLGSNTVVQADDTLGSIAFCGADGTDLDSYGAEIKALVDGTPGNNDMPGRLVFSTTADGAASPTERMRIDSTGLVTLAGPGIKFPATQVASADPNTLDDYEEGTWTPVFRDGVAGTAATATSAYGNYTKIGNCVRFHIAIINVNTSGLSSGNTIHLTGLPFAGFNGNNVEQSFPAVFNAGTVAANYVTMQIPSGASYGRMVTNSTTGQATMPVSVVNSGNFDIWISGVYFV